MSNSPAAFGLSARLARREVGRRPWRTVLVALIIALPVAGMTLAAVLLRTERLSPEQSWHQLYGSADAITRGDGAVASPVGTRTLTEHDADFQLVRTILGGRSRVFISDLAATDAIAKGMVTLDDGRLPSIDGEVLLSRSAAHDLHVKVGDTVELDRPAARTVIVTGIGHMAADFGQRLALVAPGSDLLGASSRFIETRTFVGLPDTMTSAEREAWGRAAQEVGYALSPASFPGLAEVSGVTTGADVRWTWVIGGLVLTVSGIVVGSAFASGARRQLTTLGQLAANGAGPRMLRRTLFLQGTWTGLIGSLAGLGLGAVALAAINPFRDTLFNRDPAAYAVRPIDLVPVVLMGVAAATIAALVPARTISRVPVLAALAGRRPAGRVPRHLTVSGVAALAGGLGLLALAVLGSTGGSGGDSNVWTATAVLGGVAVLLGASALAPVFVSVLGPIASRLNGPWRFAARSLVRQRTRTGAVVSAVCATCALAVMASALVLGITAGDKARHSGDRNSEVQLTASRVAAADLVAPSSPPLPSSPGSNVRAAPKQIAGTPAAPPDDLIAAIVDAVPAVQPIRTSVVDTATVPDYSGPRLFPASGRPVAVADASTLEAYRLSNTAAKALAQHSAVFLDDGSNDTPPTTVQLAGQTIDLTLVKVGDLGILSHVLITPALAAQLHLTTSPGPVILRAAHALTGDERDLLSGAYEDYESVPATPASDGTVVTTGLVISSNSNGPPPFVLEALLSGIALMFALFVVAASLALAAAETRDERDVLAVVGAAPSTMRRTSAHKAVLLALFGAALAVPVGFLPVVVFTASDHSSTPFLIFPWRTVTMLLVVVPALIGLFTAGASSLALRRHPVRVSTMTFE